MHHNTTTSTTNNYKSDRTHRSGLIPLREPREPCLPCLTSCDRSHQSATAATHKSSQVIGQPGLAVQCLRSWAACQGLCLHRLDLRPRVFHKSVDVTFIHGTTRDFLGCPSGLDSRCNIKSTFYRRKKQNSSCAPATRPFCCSLPEAQQLKQGTDASRLNYKATNQPADQPKNHPSIHSSVYLSSHSAHALPAVSDPGNLTKLHTYSPGDTYTACGPLFFDSKPLQLLPRDCQGNEAIQTGIPR
ncbi:hypothetical protein F4680DRAFT_323590 [Xylaria scruposa]|nr:hypothetical protein F4680DRAFT_323590 [Xylaria scruposa]